MSQAAAASSFEAAAWPEDWGDDTPAGATPAETTTVSQLLPAVKRAAKFVLGTLLILLAALGLAYYMVS